MVGNLLRHILSAKCAKKEWMNLLHLENIGLEYFGGGSSTSLKDLLFQNYVMIQRWMRKSNMIKFFPHKISQNTYQITLNRRNNYHPFNPFTMYDNRRNLYDYTEKIISTLKKADGTADEIKNLFAKRMAHTKIQGHLGIIS